jgi:hypothetical protein
MFVWPGSVDPVAVWTAPPLNPEPFIEIVEVSQGKTVAPDTPTPAARTDFGLFPHKSFSKELNLVQIHPNNK